MSDFDMGETPEDFRSGFCSFIGRPNVGKSTLLNQLLGEKVSIVSDKPQTTRHQIRGVMNRPDAQLVFVDTPGIHRPRTKMGERLNSTASSASRDADVVAMMIDATAPIGPGDRWVAETAPKNAILIVNKCDVANDAQIVDQLAKASDFGFAEYFPLSAVTGEGTEPLLEYVFGKLPVGPMWFPADTVSDVEDAMWVAELVREQLLAVTRDELPHSIAARVTELEWPRVRVEILVERESQKGIVIGHKGAVLKQVGINVRKQLREGTHIELFVKVEKDWQRRPDFLDVLGY